MSRSVETANAQVDPADVADDTKQTYTCIWFILPRLTVGSVFGWTNSWLNVEAYPALNRLSISISVDLGQLQWNWYPFSLNFYARTCENHFARINNVKLMVYAYSFKKSFSLISETLKFKFLSFWTVIFWVVSFLGQVHPVWLISYLQIV